jgi:glycosyltransferase involved in cell wall biosynthesis
MASERRGVALNGGSSDRKVRFVKGTHKAKDIARRVLFVSYHYPPDSQIGAKHIARVAKVLMENGWRAGVLTVREKHYERIDRSYDVPGVDRHPTGMIQSVRFLLPAAKRVMSRLAHRGARGTERDRGGAGVEALREAPKAGPEASGVSVSWIRRFIFSMIWLPDDRQGWIPFGLVRFLALLKRNRLVYSSSPPESTHLIPLAASCIGRKFVWVAEFRDPWTTFPKPVFARTKLGDWLEERWEAAVIERSARVVVVTEAMRRDLAHKYPMHADKIRLYSNGFDRDEIASFARPAAGQEPDRATFVYAGQFDYGRNPRTFLQALSQLIEERAFPRERLTVLLMSNTHVDGESIEGMARRFGVADIVRCIGYVPYDRCMRAMSAAEVLLLFSIDQPLQVPAKLYEYLALNKRILSISTGGITAELVDRTGSGMNVRPDDLPAMKEAIVALVSGKGPVRNEMEVARFDIRSIVRDLAKDLGGLMDAGS